MAQGENNKINSLSPSFPSLPCLCPCRQTYWRNRQGNGEVKGNREGLKTKQLSARVERTVEGPTMWDENQTHASSSKPKNEGAEP